MLEVGIDIVDITRFNKDVILKKNIIKKIFTDNEIQYCEKKDNSSQHYAVRFAAKEAVVKAFTCYDLSVSLRHIEIINKKNGCPYVKILDDKFSGFDIKISLSHSNDIAIAFVIVTKN
jgi:holo-[acyl-carrier protein] synthase